MKPPADDLDGVARVLTTKVELWVSGTVADLALREGCSFVIVMPLETEWDRDCVAPAGGFESDEVRVDVGSHVGLSVFVIL